jgi:protoporphyrinogen oxidase
LFKKIPDEAKKESATVYDFFSPLLGKEVTEQVLSAGLFGIFAENSKVLHFHSLFKGAKTSGSYLSFLLDYNKRKKQETKVYGPSHSISFSRGMSEIIEKLTKKLHNDLYLNANERLDYTQNIVICTDAFQASELLKGYLNEVSMLLKEVPYTHIQTSTVFLEEEIDQLENSFGVLFTPESKFQSLGLVNNKAIFDRELSSDNSSYTFISKNSKWEEDLTKLKNSPKIIEAQTKTWTRGLPIYNYERYLLMSRVKERLPKRRVVLFGNYTGDISLRGLITEARKFSNSFNPKTVI